MGKKMVLDWLVGYKAAEDGVCGEMFPAAVPGAVQLDWANAHGLPEYWSGENFKQYECLEDKYWVYQTRLKVPCGVRERVLFYCGGIDYRYKISIDGAVVLSQEGMFTPVTLDITPWANGEHLMEILIYPPPMADASRSRTQARESVKPAVSYGWDWHPRLIPLGIWEDTYIEMLPQNYMEAFDLSYELDETLTSASIHLELSVKEAAKVELSLSEASGSIVYHESWECEKGKGIKSIHFHNPKLWWPVGFGEQKLYTLKAEIKSETDTKQTIQKQIGFRKSRLVMNEGEWNNPPGFPKTRSRPPITLEINGVRLFAKGSNWVNPEIFPGIITHKTYHDLLTLVKDANFNLLRVWGGGIVNKESFYELCDQFGIMVWQEFPLACNEYPDNKPYIEVLDRESQSIIKRLRNHPSVVMWCGGNELFNGWSRMTDQSHALRLLNKNCYELDPYTPFIPTSPLYGMAHGHYNNVDTESGRGEYEFIERIIRSDYTAYTEFGCPGPAAKETIKRFMSEEEYQNCAAGTVWESHHAFGSWSTEDSWLRISEAEYYFGGHSGTDDLLEKCEIIQAINYKSMFEEMRKQWPRCSMALNWCLNEAWPAAANNSVISWPAIPKKAYYAVKEALRPQMLSLRVDRHRWRSGEEFTAEIWVLNEKPEVLPGTEIRVYLEISGQREFLLLWTFENVMSQTNLRGPGLRKVLPETSDPFFFLILEAPNDEKLNSRYQYIIKNDAYPKIKKNILNM